MFHPLFATAAAAPMGVAATVRAGGSCRAIQHTCAIRNRRVSTVAARPGPGIRSLA
jgi:hypothetical protein